MTQRANLYFKNKFPSISVMDEASDFKFGMQLGFTKVHHEIRLEKKSVWPWAWDLPEIWGFPFNVSATAEGSVFKFGIRIGFANSHHKSHPEEKLGVALG